jgi:carboxynorspermidine decarboxylase
MDLLNAVDTPAFVFDEKELRRAVGHVRAIASRAGCALLYSLKPCLVPCVLQLLRGSVDGFSVSSHFEMNWISEITSPTTIHMTAPAYAAHEVRAIAEACDYVSFNSVSQYQHFLSATSGRPQCGLRINPHCSFVGDARYDPCRKFSKLGIPIADLERLGKEASTAIRGVTGIHFHNNCDSTDFSQLFATAQRVIGQLGRYLTTLSWINIGGGYLFEDALYPELFDETVAAFRRRHLSVFVEPGAALVRKAGYLVSTVLDIFTSDAKTIAILDTTVNHAPEVFEYQYEPDVVGHREDGRFKILLVGRSCLAGDVFGEYAFDEPLTVGSRVVFVNMGAYTTTKWHMFNGINLPSIYALTESGEMILKGHFTYQDFQVRQGLQTYASV